MTDSDFNFNGDNVTFARLALALANDYESVYYLNSEDDSYVEYSAVGADKDLDIISRGYDFFADSVYNCHRLVYKEDQEMFLSKLRKESMLEAVKNGKSFSVQYRLVINGEPQYYFLKTIRGTGPDNKFIIIGVRNIDAQVRREEEFARESETYSRIAKALASRYEVIYYINSHTNEYIEYSSSDEYAKLGVRKRGSNFFVAAKEDIKSFIYPEDCARLFSELDKDTLMYNLEIGGTISLVYRQLLGGSWQYVSLTAVRPKNDDDHIIIGVVNIDAIKRREIAYREALGTAIDVANHDSLTSVKNKHAYSAAESELDNSIRENKDLPFAVAVFDINSLKIVNDTAGHAAGDEYIRSACKMICSVFKHSPVYRVGGDEFTVLLTGSDYDEREELMKKIAEMSEDNRKKGLVTVAGGSAVFGEEDDCCVKDVFKRADSRMYSDKKLFKSLV